MYEPSKRHEPDLERAAQLILWALPLIKKAINEGIDIYNFTDEHIIIEEVGILPIYKDEGYWFVSDPRASLLHLDPGALSHVEETPH